MNISSGEICAYQKAERGELGCIACSAALCAITLFAQEGKDPVNLNPYARCGTPIYPVDSMEWTPVEVRRDTRILNSGMTVTRVALRNTLVPTNQE